MQPPDNDELTFSQLRKKHFEWLVNSFLLLGGPDFDLDIVCWKTIDEEYDRTRSRCFESRYASEMSPQIIHITDLRRW